MTQATTTPDHVNFLTAGSTGFWFVFMEHMRAARIEAVPGLYRYTGIKFSCFGGAGGSGNSLSLG